MCNTVIGEHFHRYACFGNRSQALQEVSLHIWTQVPRLVNAYEAMEVLILQAFNITKAEQQ